MMMARAPSVVWVLAATLLAGVSGYLVMWLVARALGAADYSVFGVFWSGLFLIVGVLFGVQQEMTRATADALHRPIRSAPRSSLFVFAGVLAVGVAVVVALSSVWWVPATMGSEHAELSIQVALGSAANALVATVSGLLAGARLWRHLALVIAVDAVIRLVLVGLVLGVNGDIAMLAWAVILPFPLTVGIVFMVFPRTVGRLSSSALTYRELTANAGQTMLAASATALIINGFPLVLAFFAEQGEAAQLGALILAITITRAPVLVPLMALQSYLVTRFTGLETSPWKLIREFLGVIVLVMVVLAVVTLLWGTAAFEVLIGKEFALSSVVLVPLVVSSGFIGALCVTGPALLARRHHRLYSLGWVIASIVSIGMLFLPVGLAEKAALALSVGPLVGLLVHLVSLRTFGSSSTRRTDIGTAPAL